MNRIVILTAATLAAAGLGGCNRAHDQAQVERDVSKAAQDAAERSAKAEHAAQDKVASRGEDTAHTAAVEQQRLAEVDAEGSHKVALAQCESLSGENQRACKSKADADYDDAKAAARQQRLENDPKQ